MGLTLIAISASAQDAAVARDAVMRKGFHSDRNYFSPEPYEHFDPVSGNLILSFVDLELPGNAGQTLRFQRTYNAQVREPGQKSRWTFGLAGMVMRVRERPLPPPDFVFDGTISRMLASTPSFHMADGGIHPTLYQATPVASQPPGTTNWSLAKVTTAEFIRYDRSTGTMKYPNGIVAHYNSSIASDRSIVGDGRLLDFADAFGNVVTLTQSGDTLLVTQSLGTDPARVVTLRLNADGLPTEMVYAPGGQERTWTYEYEAAGSSAGVQTDLARVVPPIGPGWSYGYDADYLRWLTTPHGGRIDYGYQYRTVSVGPNPDDIEEFTVLVSRTTSESPRSWVIATDFDSLAGFSRSTTIQLPDGTQVLYQHLPQGTPAGRLLFGSVRLIEHTVRDDAGNVVQQERRTYELLLTVYHSGTYWWGSPELKTRTIIRNGREYVTTLTYYPTVGVDNFHLVQTVGEASPDGARTTTYTYWPYYWFNSQIFLVGRIGSEQVQVGADGWRRSWVYDDRGFTTQAADWASASNAPLVTAYTRDAYGNLATARVGSSEVTSYAYAHGRIREIRTPEHVTQRAINADGTMRSETAAGRTTSFTYDPLGRVLTQQPPAGLTPTVTSYDLAQHAWVQVARGADIIRTTLDGFGRAVATVDALGVQTRTRYDEEGRVVEQSLPFVPGTGAGDVREVITYDALGRERTRTHPGGATLTRQYGPGTVTLIDETNGSTTQTWQAFGNPDEERLVSVVDAANNTWRYTHDAVGRLRSVLAPDGIQRRWDYSPEGRLASETHPESGTVIFEAYDGRGLLTRKRDARGTVFDYAYDANGRLTSVMAGSRVTRFGYEAGSDRRVWASVGYRDTAGVVVDPVETRWGYDGAGRLQLRQDTLDGRTFSSWYTRDSLDNVAMLSYPSLENTARRQVQHGYDATGKRLLQLRDIGTNRVYASEFDYHPSGGLLRYRAGNNLLTQITYHPQRYWVQSITAGPLALGYTSYDGAGNLKTLTDSRAGHTQQFQYDRLHRLTGATGAYGSQTFAYDVHGNRASVPGLVTYTYDASSLRLMARDAVPFSYDGNGNLTAEPGRTYDYTVDNMVETATVSGVAVSYRYDADGWRIATTTAGATTYALRGPSNELLTEWTSPGPSGAVKDHIYAGNRLVSTVATVVVSTSVPTGVLTVGGSPATVAVAQGQDARYSFAGAAAQTVEVQLTSGTALNCNWTLAILTVTGSPLATTMPCVGTTATVSATLPGAGVYTVWVHPASGVGGTVTLVVTNVTNGAPAITAFAPTVAAPGATVTIQGSGLAGAFNVRFNTIDAGVTSAAPTTLTATVPAEAVSGRLVVTTPTGTVTSINDFFAPPPPFTAAQVASSGRLVLGVPRTVTLTTPGTIALLLLDRVAGQRFLTVGTSPSGVLHHVTILRPDGGILLPRGPWHSPSAMHDALTAPTTGTYTFLVETEATYLGTKTYTVVDVPPDATGTISTTCTPVSIPSLSVGQNARLTMYGTAGQRVAMLVDAKTITALGATLTASDGSAVWYDPIYSPGAEPYEIVTLPLTGSYSLLLNPWYEYAGAITWRICEVPPNPVVAGTVNGSAVSVSAAAPYQNATLTFAGTAGQKVAVAASGGTFGGTSSCDVYMRLLKPDDTTLGGSTCAEVSGFIDAIALPVTGTYRVVVDPQGAATGSVTLKLYGASDVTGSLPSGTTKTITTGVGQNALYTFSANSGSRLSLKTAAGTYGANCNAYLRVLKPNGSALVSNLCAGAAAIFVDATTLADSGMYTVVIDPVGANVGSVTVTRYAVPSDPTPTITLNQPPATVSTTVPGQNAQPKFSGTANQPITVRLSSSALGMMTLSLIHPNGGTLLSLQTSATEVNLPSQTLPVNGTYKIRIDPAGPTTGSIGVQVTTP